MARLDILEEIEKKADEYSIANILSNINFNTAIVTGKQIGRAHV